VGSELGFVEPSEEGPLEGSDDGITEPFPVGSDDDNPDGKCEGERLAEVSALGLYRNVGSRDVEGITKDSKLGTVLWLFDGAKDGCSVSWSLGTSLGLALSAAL